MKVYRISKCPYINDLSGTGSTFFSGRWHSKGSRVLYTAQSGALAMLESIAHLTSVVALDMCLICLQLPIAPVKEITIAALPYNWNESPSPDALKIYGDELVKTDDYLALKVPSVILPEEYNYILNTRHKDYSKIKILYTRSILIDDRLLTIKK